MVKFYPFIFFMDSQNKQCNMFWWCLHLTNEHRDISTGHCIWSNILAYPPYPSFTLNVHVFFHLHFIVLCYRFASTLYYVVFLYCEVPSFFLFLNVLGISIWKELLFREHSFWSNPLSFYAFICHYFCHF